MEGHQNRDERKRLSALKLYDILDTLPEEEYDNITKLASQICDTPIALISLSDENRQWFKSRVGVEIAEVPRGITFCHYAIQGNSLFEVADARLDQRFAETPLVAGEPFIRYYAGEPIINREGYKLGTLCVMNVQPHQLSDGQKESLKILAGTVMSLLELRYKQQQTEFFTNALNEIAAVSVIDEAGNYEYVNSRFSKLAEVPAAEIIGRNYREVTLTDIDEAERTSIIHYVKSGKIYKGTFKNQNKKGEVTWSNITVIPYFNRKNEILKLFSFRIDVTEEVRMLEKLETAERLARVGSWEINLLNGHRHWSKGMYTIMGFGNDEISATPPALVDFFSAEDKEKLQAKLAAMLRDNAIPTIDEVRVHTKDGKNKCLAITTRTLTNNKGEVVVISGTAQDITERKETETKYRSLVEETSQMTFITDADGRYTYASPRLKKVIGYEDEDIIGQQFSFIYDEDWRKKTIKFYIDQLAQQKPETNYIFPIKTSDGRKIWFEQIATLIKENNDVKGFRCVLHDITERVNTEEAMREAARLANEAREMQQSFLGKMSHEIRTPMNGVVGMVNLLANTPLSDKQRVYVDGIRDSAGNLLRIINDILDVTKIESGKMTFEETEFDLRKLVNNAIFTLKPEADAKRLILASYVDDKIPEILFADSLRLNQVLLNLAGNAVKFTEKGSVVISVEQLSRSGNALTLQFHVVDTGIGIPADKLESIFDSFTQADVFTTRKYGGTGLGLTIARQLVEQQNGTISVTSEEGRGATFSFTYICHVPEHMEIENTELPAPAREANRSLNGARILLVEDNVINQMVAQHTIELWDAPVTIADRGFKAVELLKTQKFDLILMDIQMPEMNGIQTTRKIRNELKIQTPIVAMTASAMRGEREQCLEAGMNDYFSKPFEQDDLYRILKKHLSRNDMQQKEKVFDLDSFLDLVGQDLTFARQLVDMFVSRAPQMLEGAKKSIAIEDHSQLFTEIHNLKGTIGFFGKSELDDLMTDIEKDALAKTIYDKTRSNMAVLDDKVTQLIDEAQTELAALA